MRPGQRVRKRRRRRIRRGRFIARRIRPIVRPGERSRWPVAPHGAQCAGAHTVCPSMACDTSTWCRKNNVLDKVACFCATAVPKGETAAPSNESHGPVTLAHSRRSARCSRVCTPPRLQRHKAGFARPRRRPPSGRRPRRHAVRLWRQGATTARPFRRYDLPRITAMSAAS